MADLWRLLIVDDEPAIADLVAKAAIAAGYTARTVGNGSAFEVIVREWQPTAIALDIMMPDRDGLELIGALVALAFRGHIIIMSGADPLYSQMAAASARARGLVVADVLAKPFRRTQVMQLLACVSAEQGRGAK